MMRHFASVKREFEVDECAKCGGFFLDYGELNRLRNQYATDEERQQAAEACSPNCSTTDWTTCTRRARSRPTARAPSPACSASCCPATGCRASRNGAPSRRSGRCRSAVASPGRIPGRGRLRSPRLETNVTSCSIDAGAARRRTPWTTADFRPRHNTRGVILFHDGKPGPLDEDRDPPSTCRRRIRSADVPRPRRTADRPRTGRFTLDEVTALDKPSRFDLVRPCDIKGILHSHSRWTDGAHSLESMVATAREIGLEYLGISDHFRSETHRDGLDLDEVRAQRQEIERLRGELDGFDILQGVELDVNPDGSLPVDDETLAFFDFVIVSFPENGGYEKTSLTERVVKVASHPRVTILGKPVGDFMLRGCNGMLDMEAVLTAAADGGTAVEINANPSARNWTGPAACGPGAGRVHGHQPGRPPGRPPGRLPPRGRAGPGGGICCGSILNTLSAQQLRRYLATGSCRRS